MLLQDCWLNNTGKIMFHVSAYCIQLGESTGVVRVCYNMQNQTWYNITTTKFMVVVTSQFNLVISSFPDNMFYHAWTWLLIYHNGSNNVVQACSFMKPWTVCSNMHEQAGQQPCSSWPAQPRSSMWTNRQKQAVRFYVRTRDTRYTSGQLYRVFTWQV